jgi:hypothetical protein
LIYKSWIVALPAAPLPAHHVLAQAPVIGRPGVVPGTMLDPA